MSDAYEDDLAAEEAIFDRVALAGVPQDLAEMPNKGGRPGKVIPIKLVAWRQAHNASVSETAARWGVSERTVKRMSREYGDAAKLERRRWECEQLDRELDQHAHSLQMMALGQLSKALSWEKFWWGIKVRAAQGEGQTEVVEAKRDAALAEIAREHRQRWATIDPPA